MERIENGMDQMEKWKEKKKRKMANGEESKGNNRAAAAASAATTKLRQKLADTKGSRAED